MLLFAIFGKQELRRISRSIVRIVSVCLPFCEIDAQRVETIVDDSILDVCGSLDTSLWPFLFLFVLVVFFILGIYRPIVWLVAANLVPVESRLATSSQSSHRILSGSCTCAKLQMFTQSTHLFETAPQWLLILHCFEFSLQVAGLQADRCMLLNPAYYKS